MEIGILIVLAAIASIVLTILAFIYIVPEKRYNRLNSFGKFLHDTFNFKYLIVEKILRALYIFSTIATVCVGFFMLFYVQERYYGSDEWYGLYGLLLMILGPVAIRLSYEFLMMAILLIKNVIEINGKIKGEAAPAPKAPKAAPAPAPAVEKPVEAAPVEKAEPVPTEKASFCANCGAKVGDEMFCANCGNKLK